jgi:pimeloyl-ACP methyl ester carboxylesterase
VALRAFADGALFAEVIGDGPPRVLALHGWGRRSGDYRLSLGDMNALAVDLPGFGASPPPPIAMGAEGYARALEPLLGEFAIPPVVVGHSFGGRVAVCLAAAYPDRVGDLILVGCPLLRLRPSPGPGAGYRLLRGLRRLHLLSDHRMEQIRNKRGSADYRAASGVMRDVLVTVVNESYESQLKTLERRVLLLWGAEDREVPVAVAEEALRLIKRFGGEAELEVLAGVGHQVPVQAPQALRRVVAEALAS